MAKKPPQPLDRDKLLNVALRALGSRAHSSGELREKLRRRSQSEADVDAVLAKLKESGYLNDRRFAENFAATRLEDQGLGKMRVLRDLRQRRVAPKLAEQVTDAAYQDTNEGDLIEEFLRRKYRGKKLNEFLSEEKNLAAAFRRLRYAGFSAGQSIRVLKRFANQPEVLDALESESSEPSPDENRDKYSRDD
ncbi:MAG TPA: regulatory protein RecX [Bryobacteraceae bacterium]|nr:regulatory protein RecX [Bryobacteraceae bacterium]